MKKVFVAVIMLGVLMFAVSCGESNNTRSVESLSKLVFKSIQDNDYELFQKAVLTEDQLPELMNIMGFETEEDKKEIREGFKEEYLPKIKQTFETVQIIAKQKNIDLKKAKYLKAEYKIEDEPMMPGTDVDIVFEHNGDKHKILMRTCIEFKEGWRIVEDIKLR